MFVEPNIGVRTTRFPKMWSSSALHSRKESGICRAEQPSLRLLVTLHFVAVLVFLRFLMLALLALHFVASHLVVLHLVVLHLVVLHLVILLLALRWLLRVGRDDCRTC